jgi:hypothetical protein
VYDKTAVARYWQALSRIDLLFNWTGAILPYAVLTQVDNPDDVLLNFLHTAHKAGSRFMR